MKIYITDNKLGPVMTVTLAEIKEDHLLLLVKPSNPLATLITDDRNETVSKAFMYIVEKFMKANNISFTPNGNFDSEVCSNPFIPEIDPTRWAFKIYGKEIDPMEYFIRNLE